MKLCLSRDCLIRKSSNDLKFIIIDFKILSCHSRNSTSETILNLTQNQISFSYIFINLLSTSDCFVECLQELRIIDCFFLEIQIKFDFYAIKLSFSENNSISIQDFLELLERQQSRSPFIFLLQETLQWHPLSFDKCICPLLTKFR